MLLDLGTVCSLSSAASVAPIFISHVVCNSCLFCSLAVALNGPRLADNKKICNEGAFRAGDPTKHHGPNQSILQPSLLLRCSTLLKSAIASHIQYSTSNLPSKSTTSSLWMHLKRPSQILHVANIFVVTERGSLGSGGMLGSPGPRRHSVAICREKFSARNAEY